MLIEALASYQRCVERIRTNWPSFIGKRGEYLRQQDRYGSAAEKVAEVRRMAVDAASPSRTRLSQAWWFRLVVRTILALLALWTLHFADRRYNLFWGLWGNGYTKSPSDVWLWLSWIGCSGAGGLLFGLAAWLPFARVRYLWSRLLLAALAAVPLAHLWLAFVHLHKVSGWLAMGVRSHGAQFALAVLVGVAIASGFVAKGSEAVGPAG